MASYYCLDCGRRTEHVNVLQAAAVAQVTRATVYNWLHRALVHTVVRPSGRKLICVPSLLCENEPLPLGLGPSLARAPVTATVR